MTISTRKWNMKLIMADRRKMERYVCARIPDDGIRIWLTAEGSEHPRLFADLTPMRFGAEWELVIEPSEPDLVELKDVYDHFRSQDMTFEEFWKAGTLVDPVREFEKAIASLTVTERELFDAASESESKRGEQLVVEAGHDYSGQTKGHLSTLVKRGLLVKANGYRRATTPKHPYEK